MKSISWVLFAAAAVAAAGFTPAVAAQKAKSSCVMAGGEATMVTADLAKFMAEAALKNSISGMGAKPVGNIDLKCTTALMTSCTARQRACK